MNHFNLKSLGFYGVAIGSVVILFNVVSAYGESKLKAPPAIGGSYRLNAQNLPGCLKADNLVLSIQQSGIYLFASLLPGDTNAKLVAIAEERPSLTGKLSNQKVSLSGTVPALPNCGEAIKIQGTIEEKTLTGQMALGSIPDAAAFTAQRQQPATPTQTH
jgi:hypothetical protein